MDRISWHRDGARWMAPLMFLGLVAMTGCGEEPAADAAVEAAPAEEVPLMPASTLIQAEQLETGAAAFRGQTIRVDRVRVMSRLGTKAFWVELPNKNPFLVRAEGGVTVEPQQTVDIVGTVVPVSESILADWVASGSISENDKLMAEFATDFIEAEMVMRVAPGPATP